MNRRCIFFAATLLLCLLPLSSCMLAKDELFRPDETDEVAVSVEPVVFALTDIRYPAPRDGYINSDKVRLYARNAPPSPSPSPVPTEDEESSEAEGELPDEGDNAATEEPIPFIEFEEIETLEQNELVTVLGQDAEGAYLVARTQRNTVGYIRAGAVEDFEPETMYKLAYAPIGGVKQPTLVLLESVTPGLITEPLLARTDNYLSLLEDPGAKQHAAYLPQSWLLLDKSVALKLAAVRDALAEQDLELKVVGGYYPQSVQYKLFRAVGNETLVPDPSTVSRNAQGLAVDVVLVDGHGQELAFPTPVYTYTNAAMRPFAQAEDAQRQNAELLRQVMEDAGFTSVPENWWHFYDAGKSYMISNISYDTMILKATPKDW